MGLGRARCDRCVSGLNRPTQSGSTCGLALRKRNANVERLVGWCSSMSLEPDAPRTCRLRGPVTSARDARGEIACHQQIGRLSPPVPPDSLSRIMPSSSITSCGRTPIRPIDHGFQFFQALRREWVDGHDSHAGGGVSGATSRFAARKVFGFVFRLRSCHVRTRNIKMGFSL